MIHLRRYMTGLSLTDKNLARGKMQPTFTAMKNVNFSGLMLTLEEHLVFMLKSKGKVLRGVIILCEKIHDQLCSLLFRLLTTVAFFCTSLDHKIIFYKYRMSFNLHEPMYFFFVALYIHTVCKRILLRMR